ncbi:3-hydroxybutyryl-CoA dehydrogenase [Streptomyces durmitorensis]|uniref:3-hydroxybutyryl-CoA dehydrogenase n=1 Tax=Streptomyces durmitorensis TaxID=319947 RepID=A0ABY4PL89_9ACTN|nr:3-hydroxybutyryl-CoA dehydrogenase [Streptomyces durmitorensis]UQT53728.1 3-hydroxybutyryl-CoA dehydrogenase [Streptomyces durmitorensis]
MTATTATAPPGGIHRVGIVGCGTMGSGIAEICGRAGLDVVVVVSGPAAVSAGRGRLTASLDRAVTRGKVSGADRDAALARIAFTADLDELAERDLVVEAIREDEDEKSELFVALDKVVESPEAILASNTSSIPITRLAAVTSRPERVVGAHFFNPVTVLPLVELIGSLLTGERALQRMTEFVEVALGKTAIRTRDRSGFVVNALLIPYLLSAIRMVESDVATAEVIDQGMTLGCSHPMGPLRLTDMIGLDVVTAIAESLHREFREPQFAPPTLLLRMVEARLLGKKSGRGFYSYS